jgi:hypothetical protein
MTGTGFGTRGGAPGEVDLIGSLTEAAAAIRGAVGVAIAERTAGGGTAAAVCAGSPIGRAKAGSGGAADLAATFDTSAFALAGFALAGFGLAGFGAGGDGFAFVVGDLGARLAAAAMIFPMR